MKSARSKTLLVLLSIYILLQFCWWGYLLIQGNSNKTIMVLGEGFVFLSMLFFGIWRLYKSIQQELALHLRQSNFLLSVTHELKTPLASVQLILQTLLKRPFDRAQLEEFTEKALEENKKSQQLIEQMLHASGIEHRAIKAQIIQSTPQEFSEGIQKIFPSYPYPVLWNIRSNKPFLCDSSMLIFILKNLIDNSFKYGASEIEVLFIDAPKFLEIQVIDNGIGIQEVDRPHIFDKFFRSGDEKIRERSGTGLGLYIAREMALLQEGNLIFQPQEIGSCFIISLPYGT